MIVADADVAVCRMAQSTPDEENFQFLEFTTPSSGSDYDTVPKAGPRQEQSAKKPGPAAGPFLVYHGLSHSFRVGIGELSQLSLSQLSQSTQNTHQLSLSQQQPVADNWEERYAGLSFVYTSQGIL